MGFGGGLRAQILASLFVAVVAAFSLLDLVAVRLGERARIEERRRAVEVAAALLAEAGSLPGFDRPRFDRLADTTVGRGGVLGLELELGDGRVFARGSVDGGISVESRSRTGVLARLHLSRGQSEVGRRQGEFLFAYVALTAGAILLLMYVTLTFLVVRPIERLRVASDRLAGGRLERPVDEAGPLELAALARSFNAMATDLRRDRESLVARLAELESTTRTLREAQEQIVRTEKLASVGRLSAGVAHEIGNPLAAILGLVELLESGDVPPEQTAEFVRRIHTETERIHRILRDLLDFARQGGEDAPPESASSDACAVARETIALVRHQKSFRDLAIALEAADEARVRCPEERLTQVLLNLLLNAADALAGKGTITVRITRIGRIVRIEVEDDGPGIDPRVASTIFEPFVTTKEVGKGTGLGLAVCHTIVERCGGSIRAGARDGRGARFTVELPIATKSPES